MSKVVAVGPGGGTPFAIGVCRRGHLFTSDVGRESEIPPHCPRCGASVLRACPTCGTEFGIQVLHTTGIHALNEFCAPCAHPYPWASRQAIVQHIQNQLDEEPNLPEGNRRALREQLEVLTETPSSSDVTRRQIRALTALKKVAPITWQAAQPAIRDIVEAEVKRRLGLPP
jgi:hypothetical protein